MVLNGGNILEAKVEGDMAKRGGQEHWVFPQNGQFSQKK